MDLPGLLARWRRRPITLAGVLAGAAAATAIVAAAGGSPTPLTHLFYVVVLATAVLWGASWAAGLGLVCGVLAGPGVALLLGDPVALGGEGGGRGPGPALAGRGLRGPARASRCCSAPGPRWAVRGGWGAWAWRWSAASAAR